MDENPMFDDVKKKFGMTQEAMPAAPTSAFAWPMPKKPFSVQHGKSGVKVSKGAKTGPHKAGRSGRGKGRRTQDWGY